MGYIHCCGGLRKTRSFVLSPTDNFVVCELDLLEKCPLCNHFIIQLTRLDKNNNLSSLRFSNRKAIGFWKRIQSKILYEQKEFDYSKHRGGTFYLNYNEFGVKKRCYSNFSNLKIGLIKTTY